MEDLEGSAVRWIKSFKLKNKGGSQHSPETRLRVVGNPLQPKPKDFLWGKESTLTSFHLSAPHRESHLYLLPRG